MPYSPDDKQPLVPPALKRLNPDTKAKKWISLGLASDRLSPDAPKCDFLEDSFMESEFGLDLCETEEPTGHSNYHNLNTPTGRLAKSTIHGVVNQFSQLHHRRSAMDRVVSAIGNVFRRLCHNEEGSVRLLAGYQNVDFKALSRQSAEASNQALTLFEDGEEEDKADKDRDEMYATASYQVDSPSSDTKSWVITRPKDRASNLRRKKWTLSARKTTFNDLGRESASIFEDSSDDDEHELNCSDLKFTDDSKHQLQKATPNRCNPSRSNGNGQRKLQFHNLFRRYKKHPPLNAVAHVTREGTRRLNEGRPSKLTQGCPRRRRSSLEVMYSVEEMAFGDGSKTQGINRLKKRRETGLPIRMCFSALDQSGVSKNNLDTLCFSASKSDSVLVQENMLSADPREVNLVECGILVESTGNLVINFEERKTEMTWSS